jgi:hypothetical protein
MVMGLLSFMSHYGNAYVDSFLQEAFVGLAIIVIFMVILLALSYVE